MTNFYNSTPDIMGSDDAVTLAYSDNGTNWNALQIWTAADNLPNIPSEFIVPVPSNGANVKFGILADDGSINDIEDYDFHVVNLRLDKRLHVLNQTTFTW